jgi:circadian clock protein KaiB
VRVNASSRPKGTAAAIGHRVFAMGNRGNATVIEPVLRLYVAGRTVTARRAEKQLDDLRKQIKFEWKIEIVDVLEKPELAEKAGILATPTLAYEHPERSRRVVGDLSDAGRVLEFLGIQPKGKSA